MVKITNIQKKDNRILMDCYEEGKESGYFHMVMDAVTYEILESSSPPSIYTRQARAKVRSLAEKGEELPQEASSYWC